MDNSPKSAKIGALLTLNVEKVQQGLGDKKINFFCC